MPFYRFALEGADPPLEERPEWLPIAALKIVAKVAAELSRNSRDDQKPFVVAIRSARPKDQ